MTDEMREQFKALKSMRDDEIDYSDIPEATETDFSNAVRGKFYRPRKQQVTLRIDMPVLEWFKKNAKQYQTLINTACIEYMIRHQKPAKPQRKSKRA